MTVEWGDASRPAERGPGGHEAPTARRGPKLHEEALVALMRCHACLGERSQVLRVYRRFADRLREELDTEPDGEAQRLLERLQQSATV